MRKNVKDKIKDILRKNFSCLYCDTCKNTDNELICLGCHRKYMMWEISDIQVQDITRQILEVIE